jgi:L-rhamnose-H+ transport protein
MAEVAAGILFHSVGAWCAAVCYTPQKRAVQWSWQTYWLAQAAVCWLLLPLLVAWLTIPYLADVLAEAPTAAMRNTFLLGMAYGVGGTAFGMAIRYVGFSLTYAIAVGISCVLGTLLPPLVHGQFQTLLGQNGTAYILSGIGMGIAGISLCGLAGRSKELDLEKRHAASSSFSLSKGLPLCLLAGILSAVYGFSLDQGQPIAEVAARYGSGHYQGNVIYIFSNTGAFVTTLLYCIYLHIKQRTFREYWTVPGAGAALPVYFLLAIITGVLWYGQFFFYGLGHVRMGAFRFTSWAIHMIMLVLFSTITGLVLKEWATSSKKTKRWLAMALLALVIAVVLLTYGNYLGGNVAA